MEVELGEVWEERQVVGRSQHLRPGELRRRGGPFWDRPVYCWGKWAGGQRTGGDWREELSLSAGHQLEPKNRCSGKGYPVVLVGRRAVSAMACCGLVIFISVSLYLCWLQLLPLIPSLPLHDPSLFSFRLSNLSLCSQTFPGTRLFLEPGWFSLSLKCSVLLAEQTCNSSDTKQHQTHSGNGLRMTCKDVSSDRSSFGVPSLMLRT